MKTLATIMCLLTLNTFSQTSSDETKKSVLKKPSQTYVFIGGSACGYSTSTTGALSVGIRADVTNNIFIGISATDYFFKNNYYTPSVVVKTPRFGFVSLTFDQEYRFFKDKKVNFSVFNKTGIAYASFDDRFEQKMHYIGKNYIFVNKIIDNQVYFYDEPGLDVNFKLGKFTSIYTGASYRFLAAGTNVFGKPSNYNGLNFNLGLKFKLG